MTVRALCVVVALMVAGTLVDSEEEFYWKIFEEIDPDTILDNERLLRNYLKCFYSEGTCNIHAKLIKQALPEIMSSVCGNCNDKQKGIYKYATNKFINGHPEDWERILDIYDTNREYQPALQAFLKS